jgi:hypothetical protein
MLSHCRGDVNKNEPPPRYPAWIVEGNLPSFDVSQPQGVYAAWDVLRCSKPALMLHSPLIAKVLPKWSSDYLVSFVAYYQLPLVERQSAVLVAGDCSDLSLPSFMSHPLLGRKGQYKQAESAAVGWCRLARSAHSTRWKCFAQRRKAAHIWSMILRRTSLAHTTMSGSPRRAGCA